MLAEIRTSQLTDDDRARFAFLRASNMLWALGDPARAKEIIDEASRTTPPQARSYIDAFLTVYWFAMDQPDAAVQASKNLALDDLPRRRRRDSLGARPISADAGRTTEAVAVAEAGYAVATRSLDAPHMRFNIADAHVSALLLAGRVADALEVAERMRRQAADLPGAAAITRCCRGRSGRAWCRRPRHRMLAAGTGSRRVVRVGHAIGWGYRYRVPHATALAMRGSTGEAAAALAALDKVRRRSGRWTTSGAWPGRGWPPARAPSVRRSRSCCRRPKGPQRTGNSRQKCCACRPPPSSVIAPCAPRLRELEVDRRGATRRPGGAVRRAPCATAMPLNWPPCQRNSSAWAISLPPSMRPRTPPSRIAARTCGDRRWDARHGQMPWPNNAAAPVRRRFVRPASPCR